MTASRVLRGASTVDALLAERVQRAARKLAYVADPAARALASQRSSHVAVLIPSLTNRLFVDLLEAAQQALRAAGLQTLIGVTHYDAAEEEQLIREQLLHRPSGLLLTGLDHTRASRRLLAEADLPVVTMMELDQEPDSYSVGFSQRAAATALTEHLLASGRKRIAFAAAQLDPRTLQRMQGWREAMTAAGRHDARLEWRDPAPSSLAQGAQMFEQIRAMRPKVDAILFCNDDLAQGALLEALRQGVRVPDQLAIAGFNDLPGSDCMVPPLTTVKTPLAETGRRAGEMVAALIRGETPATASVDLGFELKLRGST